MNHELSPPYASAFGDCDGTKGVPTEARFGKSRPTIVHIACWA